MLGNIWCEGSVSTMYFKNIRGHYEVLILVSIPESELAGDGNDEYH